MNYPCRHDLERSAELRDAVLLDVEAYLSRTGCSPSDLGERALNNPGFVTSLRRDLRKLDRHRAQKLRAFMTANPNGPGPRNPGPREQVEIEPRPILERMAACKVKLIGLQRVPGAFYLGTDDHALFMATKPPTELVNFRGFPRPEPVFEKIPVRPAGGRCAGNRGISKLYCTHGKSVAVPIN